MTATSKLTKKNQTTVPKAVTEALGMKPADQFLYEIQADHVILRARTGRLADMLHEPPPVPPPKRPPIQAEIDEAIGRHLAERRRPHPAEMARSPAEGSPSGSKEMIALDTNVIVRLLTHDDPAQLASIGRFFDTHPEETF